MKIITINVNGIRAACKKGLVAWLQLESPDIVCLQEVRADDKDIPIAILELYQYSYFHPATKKGYSGVAILAKILPLQVDYLLQHDVIDTAGRYLAIHYHNVSIASVYFPSGAGALDSAELAASKQRTKFEFISHYAAFLKMHSHRQWIICGDINIAHHEIDLTNFRANRNRPGFLITEREWLSRWFASGYTDSWRYLYPQIAGYTWWSNRGKAYANNVGWRIDYQIISNELLPHLHTARIYREERFSDHAPLIVEYNSL